MKKENSWYSRLYAFYSKEGASNQMLPPATVTTLSVEGPVVFAIIQQASAV